MENELLKRFRNNDLPISEVPSQFGLKHGIFADSTIINKEDLEPMTKFCTDNHDLVKDPQGYVCKKCGLGIITKS
jgi:hypothetical protein